MQSIIVLFVLGISTVLGDISQYRPESVKQPQQRALLVLPPQQTNPTSQKVQDEEETLEKLTDNVMERLRQELGSNTGVYYVYLPDGRLQRIQYTTAPIKQQDSQQQQQLQSNQQTESNGNRSTSDTEQSSQYKQNSYNTPQGTTNQQSNTQVVFGTNKQTTQGNQQQQFRTNYENNKQQSTEFKGYPQYQPEQQTGNPSQLLAQYNGPEKLQNAPAAPSYIASVQFTDVPPIHGPVYAYRPSPLVRIVRYANTY